ncbi:MAG: ABC transporter ATP-binding protein [Holophagaceae bacterium]|nr:ABC transporter ATP-binding protein [Holophagaceae bacterium]
MGTSKMLLQDVSKNYGDKVALNKINLDIQNGEILGYIGPNGAGKTTTLRIIAGLDNCFDGTLQFNDEPWSVTPDYLSHIGYMPQSLAFAPWRTVKETLQLFGRLSGISGECLRSRIDEIVEFVELKDALLLRCLALSGGMSQRLNLAQALLHEPSFVILDEPFNQLDPIGRTQLKKMIMDLKGRGVSVLFSSHILSDVEELADRVAIINHGELLFQGNLNELHKVGVDKICMRIGLFEATDISHWMDLATGITSITEIKPCVYMATIKPDLIARYESIAQNFLTATVSAGIKVKEFRIVGLSLDELFINLVGEGQ